VVVAPLAIVDCLFGLAVVATTARSFAVDEVAHVDVFCLRVLHSTLLVFAVCLPVSLVNRAIEVDHLANTLLHEKLVLPEVNVSIRVEQFADRAADTYVEFTVEDDARVEQQVGQAVQFILRETAPVLVAILEDHLSFVPLIVLPNPLEGGAIAPSHGAVAVALSSLEVTLVLTLLVLGTIAW